MFFQVVRIFSLVWMSVLRRPAALAVHQAADEDVALAAQPAADDGKATFDVSQYSHRVQSYASREEALEDLGCRGYCKGHAARILKTSGKITHLRCRLRGSFPPCKWAAVLQVDPRGAAHLYQLPRFTQHNDSSAPVGKQGFDTLDERKKLTPLLKQPATARPKTALRQARLPKQGGVRKAILKQVQGLRRRIVKKAFRVRTVGELQKKVTEHAGRPADALDGYFCYHHISSPGPKQKPVVTVVCTTRCLQQRWSHGHTCAASIDGGFKFNLLGWPLHAIGIVNPAGNFGLCAIGMTSTMQKDHITSMLQRIRRQRPRGDRRGRQQTAGHVRRRGVIQARALPRTRRQQYDVLLPREEGGQGLPGQAFHGHCQGEVCAVGERLRRH